MRSFAATGRPDDDKNHGRSEPGLRKQSRCDPKYSNLKREKPKAGFQHIPLNEDSIRTLSKIIQQSGGSHGYIVGGNRIIMVLQTVNGIG